MRLRLRIVLCLALIAGLVLGSCSRVPDAGEFLAPEFGTVEVTISPYKVMVSCIVDHLNSSFTYGFVISGEGVEDRTVEASPSGKGISVTFDEISAQTKYSVKAFASSGQNVVSSAATNFKTGVWEPVISIPDPSLKKYVVERFDEDGDGQISQFEANNVDRIEITADVTSLEGIEAMRNLTHLEINSPTAEQGKKSGRLVYADVSHNNHLKYLQIEGFHLRTLILPEDRYYLEEIHCVCNDLEMLDASNCPMLRVIYCWNNYLTELNMAGDKELTELNCWDNSIRTIDLSGLENLRIANFYDNSLSSLDVSDNENLEELDCGYNYIRNLDLSRNYKLTMVRCENNNLTDIDVTMLHNLRDISVCENPIPRKLDLSRNPELTDYAGNNIPIYDIPDFSHNPKLISIHISTIGGAEYIDKDFFCQWPDLVGVNFCGYKGEEINIGQHSKLESVWANEMQNVKELDLSSAKNLRLLEIQGCPQLKTVYLNKAVDISKVELKMDDGADTRFEYK